MSLALSHTRFRVMRRLILRKDPPSRRKGIIAEPPFIKSEPKKAYATPDFHQAWHKEEGKNERIRRVDGFACKCGVSDPG